MSTPKRATLVGVIAFVLAVSLIATAILTGTLPGVNNVNTSQTGQQTGQGTLSIMLTDPPVTPPGVTEVYISYANIEVHVSNAGNQTGWYPVNAKGTIELLGTVNVSQTLATVSVKSGDYNLIRFNLTSAEVTYDSANYTAFVPTSTLTVRIVGGVEVNSTTPSAAILDLQTTVVNIGSHSDPEFMIRPVVRAYTVPSSQITVGMEQKGFRQDLNGLGWWRLISEHYTANLQITTASLAPGSLSLTVKNTGNQSTIIGLVTVSPLTVFLGGSSGRLDRHVPDSLLGSANFVVLKNGTLVPLRDIVAEVISARVGGESAESVYENILGTAGYNLTVGSSATFTYSAQILEAPVVGSASSLVISGQQYVITALGTQAVASIVVTAS